MLMIGYIVVALFAFFSSKLGLIMSVYVQVDSKVDLHEVINKLDKIVDWDHKILSVNFHSFIDYFYWTFRSHNFTLC